ncbi:porin family protein [Lewinella sp. 4G2]|uniref:porin family protein n=1 Tax=Lewinella sp. 4G2 TaxID=1803372 RepID=UPI0007B4BFD2|nr:porin family protein [Lewinella sp. 4G2]OAV45575.1 hypothetical protein A3850_014215 [Lewinella sp. 4G2]
MTRFLLSSLFVLTFTTAAFAQSFGLRVGANATDASYERESNTIETEGETNLMLGIFLNIPLGTDLISLQPEVNYLNKGYSFENGVSIGGNSVSFDRTLSYVDLGVLARLNLGSDDGLGFYVGAGPQFSYAVSGQVTVIDVMGETERDVDFDVDNLNRSELQVTGVAGLTFNLGIKFFVEGRYNGALTNQSDQGPDEIRQRSIGINGGIMVPLR